MTHTARGRGRVRVSRWKTRLAGDRRVCDVCETVIRRYRYRFHRAESPSFERCVGVVWCSQCRVFDGSMVYVPRDVVLVDALAGLPPKLRYQLRHSDPKLVQYLDVCGGGLVDAP
jgi:hypothetical protein